eukprot:6318546-Pyramimonas_sp.AAC.1
MSAKSAAAQIQALKAVKPEDLQETDEDGHPEAGEEDEAGADDDDEDEPRAGVGKPAASATRVGKPAASSKTCAVMKKPVAPPED